MRILVGLDGSPAERQVLDDAVALAAKLDGRLILFHAVSLPVPLPTRALAVPPDEVGPMLATTSREHVEELARSVPARLLERVQVELGVPWRAICEIAHTNGVDLIVVGSHSYAAVDRLIGTTAAKVVNHAQCSVLVTR
jgi:nucleotide-binding universal stress UspA family protein